MKYSDIALTVIAVLFLLVVIKMYFIPQYDFEKLNDSLTSFIDKKNGVMYNVIAEQGELKGVVKFDLKDSTFTSVRKFKKIK